MATRGIECCGDDDGGIDDDDGDGGGIDDDDGDGDDDDAYQLTTDLFSCLFP